MIRHLFFYALCMTFLLGCSSDQAKVEKFIAEGQTYLEQKDYDKANIQLQNALELAPKSVEAHKLLVKICMAQKDIQKTFQSLLALEEVAPDDMDTKLQIASIYMMSGESGRPKAKTRIDQVLKKEPDNIKALSLQASMLILEKEPVDAIANVYERILTIDPSNSHAMLMLAKISNQKGESSQAKILLEKAVTSSPDDFKMYTELYAYYLTNKDHENAKDVLERLADKKPSDPDPQILLGNFYSIQNQPDMAEAAYQKAIELAPENPGTYMALAQFYDKNGKTEKAESIITDAIRTNPDDMPLQLVHARFLYDHKKLEQALVVVDNILEKKENFQPAMELKGRIFLAQENPDSASVIFSSLLKADPDSPVFNYLMASAFMDMNKPDLAIVHASKAIKNAPDYFEARFLMANLYYKRKNLALADAEIKKALEIFPKHDFALLLQGQIYNALGKKDIAESIYRELIKSEKTHSAAYFNLGNLYFDKKELTIARENYEKALEQNPYLMDVFSRLILTYALEKKFQEGLQKCDEQLQKIQNHPIAVSIIFNQKGNLFMGMEDTEQAKAAYETALDKNPKYILPYLALSRIYKIQNQPDQTIKILEKLANERPDQAGAFSSLGALYESQGKMDQAETNYVKALEINPSHIQALNNLAFLYAEENREMNKALEYARKARELAGEDPTIMDTLGWVYYRKQLYDAAIQEFTSCIEKQPKNPLFHYHMGLALEAKGDTQAARASLQKALDIGRDFPGKDDAQNRLKQMQ